LPNDTPAPIGELIGRYELEPHPEGGFYRRVWQHPTERDGRTLGTATLYLLPGGSESRWHRIDTVEHWHAGRGAALELRTSVDGRELRRRVVGTGDDQLLIATVEAHEWQSARSLGDWSLVVVTVTPGFVWEGLELAPDGWEPGPR
jgi:predicted cupin superfamily sugar epimerase